MSSKRMVDSWIRFDEVAIELELQVRVVLRCDGYAVDVIDRVIVLLEQGLPVLRQAVENATADLVVVQEMARQGGGPEQAGVRAAGRRIAMMSIVLGNRAFALAFARRLRKLRVAGETTEVLTRACMAQALALVPVDLPVEQWVDSLVPPVVSDGGLHG